MAKALKNRASKQEYTSQIQQIFPGFETPFAHHLDPTNRWVVLARRIPWDILVSVYQSQMRNSMTGADGINPRVAIGAIIIKHMCAFDDRETVLQMQENMYMQYFIGYSSFSNEPAFDPSLFVDFRKRLGIEQINEINERILGLSKGNEVTASEVTGNEGPTTVSKAEVPGSENQGTGDKANEDTDENKCGTDSPGVEKPISEIPKTGQLPNQGQLIVDATACPQDIRYPTDLDILNDTREKSEELIDFLYCSDKHQQKPRTYREIAHTVYLKTAQKRQKTKKEIRTAVKRQLNYVRRNINSIHKLLSVYDTIPFKRHHIKYKYLLVIQTVYEQQVKMFEEKVHRAEHRIVSIHQPHVRPIVRGKTNAKVEFGAKIEVSIMNGFSFLEEFSWEAYNEGGTLMNTVEKYKKRFGYYPKYVLVDQIYCTRKNRTALKLLGITLRGKPLGRTSAAEARVRPGERNPIEGKFGQAKTAYGMNRIKARLQQTSESWIASIVLVLNLVKLAGQIPFCLLSKIILQLMEPNRVKIKYLYYQI